EHARKRLDSAHRRYLYAIKQLAIVRKLLTPAVSPLRLAGVTVHELSPAVRKRASRLPSESPQAVLNSAASFPEKCPMSTPTPVPTGTPSSEKLLARLLDDDAAVRQAALEELDAADFCRQRKVLQAIIRRAVRPQSKVQQRAVDVLRTQACLAEIL